MMLRCIGVWLLALALLMALAALLTAHPATTVRSTVLWTLAAPLAYWLATRKK